ncbi:aromatic acid/H+ symport family MFS transporter [Arthrobacter sp. zg-Y411]|uniref:MFS transporter n=1 Tax=Arthrobacter zhangbolii TaxID=2886936 RepID=UPI001D13B814|nr:aromatic acid/H+ symport family MFS transporter [Arthrobacter zhangbolii]MCC3295945.1 aromatic acid/H+ symport family MFS transporter [Arthrobacter zhangbolii]
MQKQVMTPRRRWIVALCWLTVVFEGYDIVALGAAIPTLLDTRHVGITAAGATYVSTISLVGVGIGAALIGPLSDRWGRRVPLILCVVVFSLFTLVLPLMPSVALMGVVRFIAGLGLGGCMPVAITAMQEAASENAKANASTITMTGYHCGAVLASVLAIIFREHWGWLFYAGGALGLAAAVVMWFRLPETGSVHLAAKDSKEKGAAQVKLGDLLRPPYLRITLGLWVAAFMGLMLVYGLNTWLPQIMREAGYRVSASLVLLLVLNVGAVIGLLIGGRVADKRGPKGTTMAWFGAAAVLLAILSIRIESSLLLNAVVLVTGVFVFCAQVLVYGFVGYLYPRAVVGSAMGFVAGVGRLGAIVGPWLTGALVTAGIAYPFGFYVFALAAALGVVAVAVIPRPGRPVADTADPRVSPDGQAV